jgi:quercetin dioxygenase-like cupin family protein
MSNTAQTLQIPSGARFTPLESTTQSGGARVEFEIVAPPGAPGPPPHYHPPQQESWQVLDGELTVTIDGQERTLAGGDEVTIAPGTVHTFANRGSADVRFRDLHTPALDFEEYIETLARLTTEAKLTSRVKPVRLIYGAMVLHRYRSMQFSASATRRTIESVLAILGRILRFRIDAPNNEHPKEQR